MRRHVQPQPLRDYAGVDETMLRHRAIEMPDRGLQKGATLRRFLIEPANVRDDRLRLVGQDRNDCKANGSDRVGCEVRAFLILMFSPTSPTEGVG